MNSFLTALLGIFARRMFGLGPSDPQDERSRVRPVCCGMQIANGDDNARRELFDTAAAGGTLGCFVSLDDGAFAILSANHVIAAQNNGLIGSDQIFQPTSMDRADRIAILEDFVHLRPSPGGASPGAGNVVFNQVDAAIARLAREHAARGVDWDQAYLALHGLPPIEGVSTPSLNDEVFKVGQGTGLTRGRIATVNTIVGLPYDVGDVWFEESFVVEPVGPAAFAAGGDSGAVVVKSATNEALGIVYGGHGNASYAFSIQRALELLRCTLA